MNDDAALKAALDGSRILLAPGLFGEALAWFNRMGMDYMGAQAAWLRGLELPVELLALPSAAPVGRNGGRIATAILSDPRPVLLIGHSKGGLEALSALLRPEAAGRCRGFIALQSPFGGSPVADVLCGPRPLRLAAHHAVRGLKIGTGRGLRDLTTNARTQWLATHADTITQLFARLPVVTAATVLNGRGWNEPYFRALARWMSASGAGPSDGLVPLASALLPGAGHAVLPGGHRALVSSAGGHDPVGVLRRLMWQALGR